MLNLDTLLLVEVCVTLLTTVLLVVSACYTASPPEQRWWAGGNVAVSAGVVLTNTDTPLLLNSVLGYGVVGFGLALVLRGVRVYCADALSWRAVAAITAPVLLVPAYYALVAPSMPARVGATSIYFAAINWVCAYTLARHGGWRGVMISVAGFGALGLALLLRGFDVLVFDGMIGNTSLLMRAILLLVPLAQICIAFGLIMMVMWRYAERLRRLSTLDVLTGALNRAGLEILGKRVALRALRGGRSVAIIMIDVDSFKAINDTYGHPVGDEVLRHMADLLRVEMRPDDLLARLGGEEFVLVLDDVDRQAAVNVAERLRARIEEELVEIEQLTVRYTASMGVACSEQHGYDLIRLISAGDAAMYEAKRAGRNRVISG